MKTAPLWGLKHRAPYLHDGRALPRSPPPSTTTTAKPPPSRDRFNKLPNAQQKQLVDFLNSL
ncbi:MAG: hypothetical protein WDN28_17210 [Chthoniobacter sp.]